MSKDNVLIGVIGLLVVVSAVQIFKDPVTVQVASRDGGRVEVVDRNVGGFPGPDVYQDMIFHNQVNLREKSVNVAKTSIYSTTTIQAQDSGTTYYLSASGTTMTLPAVTAAGATYRFVVSGSLDSGNVIVDSAEGDNINGTLTVNNADVACSGEDQINFVTDGETVGDYVEVRSDGTQWLIGDSTVETAAKMTCTNPS